MYNYINATIFTSYVLTLSVSHLVLLSMKRTVGFRTFLQNAAGNNATSAVRMNQSSKVMGRKKNKTVSETW